jgi:hypothetical protein
MTGKSKLSSSEWPVYSSKILEQTMYLSYTIFIWFSLLFDKQFHFRFQNNKTWIQYFGSISTHATFFKNNNSNVHFLQCILLSSFATQFYWYLERCSIIILHRCHLLHLCMLVSSTAFVRNWKWRCKTLLFILFCGKIILQKYFQKFHSYNFLFVICINCSIKFQIMLEYIHLQSFTKLQTRFYRNTAHRLSTKSVTKP